MPSPWTVDGLSYPTRIKLTVDQTKIDANLTDFPVLVKLTSARLNFANANSDGFDIRFTSDDESTLLKYERLRHDSVNSLAEYWVKVASVSGTVDTVFYMYFRTTDTADGADPTNVWDASFAAVYHLNGSYNGTAGEVKDSTAAAAHGTATDAPTQVTGQASQAQNFNGDTDFVTLTDLAAVNYQADWTNEILFNTDGLGAKNFRNIWWKSANIEIRHDTDISIRQLNFNTKNPVIAAVDISIATWYHMAFTWDWLVTTGNAKIYQNGVQKDNSDGDTFAGTASGTTMILGRGSGTGREWDGILEEFRISTVVRAAAWIKGTYNACFDLLNTYGVEEGGAAAKNLMLLGVGA